MNLRFKDDRPGLWTAVLTAGQNQRRASRRAGTLPALVCLLGLMVFSSAACVRQVVRSAAFWKSPPPRTVAARNTALPQSRVRQVFAQQAQGAFDPAIGDRRVQLLNAKLRLDPQDVEARVELGGFYEYYSMDELAFDQFTRGLNLDPENLPALLGLARVARRDSAGARASEAIPIVRTFLDRNPESVPALSALGSLLDTAGDLPAAESVYRQGLEKQPQAAYLHNNLGFNLLLQSRNAAAVLEFRRALELNPQSAAARNNLGVALARMGDRPAALRVFTGGGADPATAHNNLAVALLEQGELEESRAELMEALTARSFFAPALENFKLLLGRDRDRHALAGAAPLRPLIPKDWLQPLPAPPAPAQAGASNPEGPSERKP